MDAATGEPLQAVRGAARAAEVIDDRLMYWYIRSVGIDRRHPEWEDAVQEGMIARWVNRHKPDPVQGIAIRRRVIDYLRRWQRRGHRYAEAEVFPLSETYPHESVTHMGESVICETIDAARALEWTKDRDRRALWLEVLGYTHIEIGRLFGVSERRVGQLVKRARRVL